MPRSIFNPEFPFCPSAANQFYPLYLRSRSFLHWFQGQRPVVLVRAASGAKEPRLRTNARDSPTGVGLPDRIIEVRGTETADLRRTVHPGGDYQDTVATIGTA